MSVRIFVPALLATVFSTAVAAQNLPNQCQIMENRNDGVLVAECPSSQGPRASAIRAEECRSNLSNRDGVLACTGTTALVGPLRAASTTSEGRINDFLASVLGTQRPNSSNMDMSWSQSLRPSAERRTAPETRIADALRNRTLSDEDARTLRNQHRDLITLESRYASDGRFTPEEYAQLEDEYARLNSNMDNAFSANQYASQDNPNWPSLARRRADFDDRVLAALDARAINLSEANKLRADWNNIANIETGYARNGLDSREIADLQNRLNALESRLGRFSVNATKLTTAQDWAKLETRITQRENDRSLNRNQIDRLRTEHGDLARLDAAWRRLDRGRLTKEQQNYLDKRRDELSDQIDDSQRRRQN